MQLVLMTDVLNARKDWEGGRYYTTKQAKNLSIESRTFPNVNNILTAAGSKAAC